MKDEKELQAFVFEAQKECMKQIWDNEYDEVWERV